MRDLDWRFGADTVMGGISDGIVQTDGGAARLTGTVRLENNGGFIQMSAEAGPLGGDGLRLEARGDGGAYFISLRTTDLTRPWQSYRFGFTAPSDWTPVNAPWEAFEPNRTDAPFDPGAVRRIGILSVGTAREVDVAVRGVSIWRADD